MTTSPRAGHLPQDQGACPELARCVRAWRLRLDPDNIDRLRDRRKRHRRHRIVSQAQVAAMIGFSTQWYSRLEVGELQNYSDEFLQSVSDALRLNPDEIALLFLLAGKQSPKAIPRTNLNGLESVLEAQPWPAYLTNQAWDLIGHNEHMRALAPSIRQGQANVMRWAFMDPAARQLLHHWDTAWAPQLLLELRSGLLRYPDDTGLNGLIVEILELNADARRLWADPLTSLPPTASERWLNLGPDLTPCRIHVVTLEPDLAPGHRLTMLVPESSRPQWPVSASPIPSDRRAATFIPNC